MLGRCRDFHWMQWVVFPPRHRVGLLLILRDEPEGCRLGSGDWPEYRTRMPVKPADGEQVVAF
jgi:hypothetical protein